MTVRVRRVVTGHDANGRAKVLIDEIAKNVESYRAQQSHCVLWSSPTLPADNGDDRDPTLSKIPTTLPDGVVFRVVEYGPGVAPRNHRTQTLDFAVVVSGEIDMQLDDSEVHLKAGDMVVQRGTIHNWVNRGSLPCVIAFVLVPAAPVKVGDSTLPVVG